MAVQQTQSQMNTMVSNTSANQLFQTNEQAGPNTPKNQKTSAVEGLTQKVQQMTTGKA
jgi:hypothetical protein